jgi:hypothetical protein
MLDTFVATEEQFHTAAAAAAESPAVAAEQMQRDQLLTQGDTTDYRMPSTSPDLGGWVHRHPNLIAS